MGKEPLVRKTSQSREMHGVWYSLELAIPLWGVNTVHEMWSMRPGSSCPCAKQQFLSLRSWVGMKRHDTILPRGHGSWKQLAKQSTGVLVVGGSNDPEFLQMLQIQTLPPDDIPPFKVKVVVWHHSVPTSPWVSHACATLATQCFNVDFSLTLILWA